MTDNGKHGWGNGVQPPKKGVEAVVDKLVKLSQTNAQARMKRKIEREPK